jgi:GTP-binding protein Era
VTKDKPDRDDSPFRSGFVTIVGMPNAGKSTLINSFLNKALCITSFKPQTTRYHLRCIVSSTDRQIIFVDTPGWVASQKAMDKALRKEIYRGAEGVDVIVYLIDATRLNVEANREAWKALVSSSSAHKVIAVNKIDKLSRLQLIPILDMLQKNFEPEAIVPISAFKGKNLDELDKVVSAFLPKGPRYYPEDQMVDRPLEFVLSEFVREQLYHVTREELPFSTAVHVEQYEPENEAGKLGLRAAIFVEKESQKGILIGAGGAMIKDIRERATKRIQKFLGHRKVKLELTVRVKKNWRQDPEILKTLGFE